MSSLSEGIGLIESQPDQYFFQDDNEVQTKTKTTIKFSNKKVKTRNLLTNVSYRRYKPEDVEKTNFVINVSWFLTQNLNPTGLHKKLETPLKRDYVKIVWDSCVPHKFSKFIYQKENFIEISQPHITYQKADNIVLKFVEEGAQYIHLLKSALRDHLQTIQYVYSLLFPKIYNRTSKFGINNKLHFDFILTNWRHHKINLVLPTPTKNKVVGKSIKKKKFRNWYNTTKTTTRTTTTKWTRKRGHFMRWKKTWKLRKKSCSSLWAKTRKK